MVAALSAISGHNQDEFRAALIGIMTLISAVVPSCRQARHCFVLIQSVSNGSKAVCSMSAESIKLTGIAYTCPAFHCSKKWSADESPTVFIVRFLLPEWPPTSRVQLFLCNSVRLLIRTRSEMRLADEPTMANHRTNIRQLWLVAFTLVWQLHWWVRESKDGKCDRRYCSKRRGP